MVRTDKCNISNDAGPVINSNQFSFTMLKLDTTQSSRPQLKDTIGPIELLDISQANSYKSNGAKNAKLQQVVATLVSENKFVKAVIRIHPPKLREAALQAKPPQNSLAPPASFLQFYQTAPLGTKSSVPDQESVACPAKTTNMWTVESVFDFEGSKFLVASNPKKVGKASKKTAR